jgi:ABC-type lipoprotein export system ATPase subunit
MIRLENVCKHFAKGRDVVRALDRISLDVPQGAFALVRGPSGSGKTTLINVIAGLTRPTSGSVTVAGERLGALTPRARAALRAKRVAVVFQMFHLVPYLTALENVLLPTLAARTEDSGVRAKRLIADLDIAHRADHFPSEMSAGERQRCALARALLNRPDVILADEPTGNLDEDSARHVLKMLHEYRTEGTTILLVSHQAVEEIQPDLEFRLKAGRLGP